LIRKEKGQVGLYVAIGLALILIPIAIFGIRWVTAGPKGALGAREQQQSANTRVQKQELFEQLAADFDGYIVKIDIANNALKEAKIQKNQIDTELRATELIGLKQTCVDAAQQFNAESRKYTARVWKSAGLPISLDPTLCN